jgi:hypothetical protein
LSEAARPVLSRRLGRGLAGQWRCYFRDEPGPRYLPCSAADEREHFHSGLRDPIGYVGSMLDYAKISEIADAAARSHLNSTSVAKVSTEPAVDSEGREALRITIVLKPGKAAGLAGDAVLDTLVEIQNRLRLAGEERFPIVDYAAEDELENGGGSQS